MNLSFLSDKIKIKGAYGLEYDFVDRIENINVHNGIRSVGFRKQSHHFHSWYEMFFVIKGSCEFQIYDKIYNVTAGQVLLLRPGVFHYYTSAEGCEYIIIEVTAGYMSRFFSEEAIKLLLQCFDSVVISPDNDDFKECQRLAKAADNNNNINISGRYLAVAGILNILNNSVNKKSYDTADTNSKRRHTLEKLNGITEYISSHYKEISSLSNLAKSCYISKSHMCRIFKQELGISVAGYINNVRINAARELLLSTKMSVLDIALECGFNSAQYFHRQFKLHLGCSPSEYRNNQV